MYGMDGHQEDGSYCRRLLVLWGLSGAMHNDAFSTVPTK